MRVKHEDIHATKYRTSPVEMLVNVIVPLVTPSTCDMNLTGNSFALLGPTSTTSETVTKTALHGFSCNTTLTKNFCTTGSQFSSTANVDVGFFAGDSKIRSEVLSGFSAYPLS